MYLDHIYPCILLPTPSRLLQNANRSVSHLHVLFVFFLYLESSLVLPTCSWACGHPWEHGQHTSGNTPNEKCLPLPKQQSTAKLLEEMVLRNPSHTILEILIGLILYKSYIGNHSCCDFNVQKPCHIQRTAFQALLPIL